VQPSHLGVSGTPPTEDYGARQGHRATPRPLLLIYTPARESHNPAMPEADPAQTRTGLVWCRRKSTMPANL